MTSGRHARHELIPGWRQDRLAGAEVVVLGVGAVGNEVARLLAQAGTGRLLLCDPDTVELSNLSRAPLFRARDLGRPKVEAAAHALADLAPGTAVETVVAPHLHGVGLARLRDADLVLSCLDSMAARISLSARCAAVRAGLLDAGTSPWAGQVCYYPPDGACLGCDLGPGMLGEQDDPWSCSRPTVRAPDGASGAVSSLIGSWQATTALRVLLGLPVSVEGLLIDPVGVIDRLNRVRRQDCPLHEELNPTLVRSAKDVTTAGGLRKFLAPGEEALSWVELPGRTLLFSAVPDDASLRELGVAAWEILPVARRSDGAVVSYLELGGLDR